MEEEELELTKEEESGKIILTSDPKSKYKDRSWSEQTIQRLLYKEFNKMYYKISNVFLFGQWETDFFFMTKSRKLWEVEIKVDRQDYDRDFKLKPKKHRLFQDTFDTKDRRNNFLPNFYYFCAPEGVIPRDSVPEYAGLIEVYGENKDKMRYAKRPESLHDEVQDVDALLLKKFYNHSLKLEKLLMDFRISCFENPDDRERITEKFLKRIRM